MPSIDRVSLRAVALARWPLVAAAAVALVASCTFDVEPDGERRFSCDTAEDCGDGFECIEQANGERGVCFERGVCADAETDCDGQDEDCDGVADNDVVWVGTACETELLGVCRPGKRACQNGVPNCVSTVPITAEQCNALDDDCDGQTDEDFDLATDEDHCGACGAKCAMGAECEFSACVERDCADTADNDTDGVADCFDADCIARPCADEDPTRVCALAPFVPDAGEDGGTDGGDVDGGDLDGGEPDAGELDGGDLDAGEPDAGDLDAGDPDAGELDGGEVDGGELDGGDADAGVDAGLPPDAGPVLVPACVAPESVCDNGLDDDGDGFTDCEDVHCELKPCGPGTEVCSGGTCQ